MTKKLSIDNLKEQIRSIVKREVQKMNEQTAKGDTEMNPIFSKLGDKNALSKWMMRYYFKPEKKGESWWNKNVTEKNVLTYVSNPRNNFPLTPKEIADDWRIKKSLKSDLSQIDDSDIEDYQDPTGAKKKGVNHVGDVPMKDLGQEMGLTIPSIMNLERSGMERMMKMFGTNPMNMDSDDLDAVTGKIEQARTETSKEFADALVASGDVRRFIQSLVKSNVITDTDVRLMTQQEAEMLLFLMNKPADQVAEYLRGDILKNNNRVKTFQAAVARKVFPAGKRGRPKKNP